MEKNIEQSIESLLKENRSYPPSQEFKDNAKVQNEDIYTKANQDRLAHWEQFAKELDWFQPWDSVLEWNPPHPKWFVNGKLNVSYNCLDRHLKTYRRNKAALIWEGEPGECRMLSYWDLYRETCKFANVLKQLGINKGDRVAIYMPMVPEAAIAMLACTRIGAVHSVIFGGFSPHSISDRVNDCQAKLVVTADGGHRRGNLIQLKANVDEALETCPSVENVVVVKRGGEIPIKFKEGRDHWWHRIMEDQPMHCEPEPMDSEDILFILYTSGTTGKPKGIVHTTGGYLTQVAATSKLVFDLNDQDVYWCSADVGWITGHSYVVYGPLANGATNLIYEGSPDWPNKNRFWDIIEKFGVTILYTAPTAIRAFMKWGLKYLEKHDLSSLRLLGSVGEPINPEAWMWYHKYVGNEKCPIVDTWWQTETGAIMITPLPGITHTKPGSATQPFPGIDAQVINEAGEQVQQGGGYLVVKEPWPSMLRGIWGDEERFKKTYWGRWENTYFAGDGARIDEDKFMWLLGRVDDIINVAGHNIGTMEVESALVEHEQVAEAAVVGKHHDIKGQVIVAFVTLTNAKDKSYELVQDLKVLVSKTIGKLAMPETIVFTPDLPKTRSGKIMRRILKDIAEGREPGDTTTLSDPNIIEKLQHLHEF